MATVASLWVGGPLGKVEELCLSSFIYYGHTVYLYVYDMNLSTPDGVTKLDANQILSESRVFRHHGQLAAFSDLFRYYMIKKTNITWIDTDMLCLSEYFFEDRDAVFVRQTSSDKWEEFSGGILKLPPDSSITDDLIIGAEHKIKSGLGHWCDIGPILLTNTVNRYGFAKFAIDENLVNMVTYYKDTKKFWIPKFKKQILGDAANCYSATFFTGGLAAEGIDKNTIVPGSAIEYFYNKFVLRTSYGR